jgi:hypothetical protein
VYGHRHFLDLTVSSRLTALDTHTVAQLAAYETFRTAVSPIEISVNLALARLDRWSVAHTPILKIAFVGACVCVGLRPCVNGGLVQSQSFEALTTRAPDRRHLGWRMMPRVPQHPSSHRHRGKRRVEFGLSIGRTAICRWFCPAETCDCASQMILHTVTDALPADATALVQTRIKRTIYTYVRTILWCRS